MTTVNFPFIEAFFAILIFLFFCLPSTRLPSSWAYSPCPHLSESKLFVSIDKRIFLKFSKIVVFVETQNKSLTCGQKKFCRAVMVIELVLLSVTAVPKISSKASLTFMRCSSYPWVTSDECKLHELEKANSTCCVIFLNESCGEKCYASPL